MVDLPVAVFQHLNFGMGQQLEIQVPEFLGLSVLK